MKDERDWDPSFWPEGFIKFLNNNKIDPQIYLQSVLDEQNRDLMLANFQGSRPLDLIKDFLVLENATEIAHTMEFKKGIILPMDPSSYFAVLNLNLCAGDHVLDLCCAPGTKSVLISKILGNDKRIGSLTGVDISKERLASAITLVKKYKLSHVRLFQCDGRTFRTPAHEILSHHDQGATSFKNLYKDHRPPTYSSTSYRKFPGRFGDSQYDKVLVDAQCTHDGSVKHIRKQMENGWKDFNPFHYSEEGLRELYDLQFKLLENGFLMTKIDGIIVYSTCSLTIQQNESIIERFISIYKDQATILPPIGPDQFKISFSIDGEYQALRINPSPEIGGGFFVCRIKRLK